MALVRVMGSLTLALAVTGCIKGTTSDGEALPGHETGPCQNGDCLSSLMCLSDVCVDPDAEPDSDGSGDAGDGAEEDGADDTPAEGGSGADGADGETTKGNEDDGAAEDAGTTSGEAGLDGCAVDLVMLMDNSGSMAQEQPIIAQGFEHFVARLQAAGATDLRIMVMDTDTGPNGYCMDICSQLGTCGPLNPGYDCFNPPTPEPCESAGAGRVEGAAGSCGVVGGERWITGEQPNFDETLGCILNVGNQGLDEKPIQALVAGLVTSTLGGMCNGEFLRDNAKLFITFASDEEDTNDGRPGSSGGPTGWHSALVSAKGSASDTVVLGLIGDQGLAGSVCEPWDEYSSDSGPEPAPRLAEFIETWGDNGLRGSVCLEDMRPEFDRALEQLATVCAR